MFTTSRVYCKYHYLEGHESDNPEIEIWKFLVNISKNLTDISKKQYTKEASETFSVESKYFVLLLLPLWSKEFVCVVRDGVCT